jgi:hypothetical protein
LFIFTNKHYQKVLFVLFHFTDQKSSSWPIIKQTKPTKEEAYKALAEHKKCKIYEALFIYKYMKGGVSKEDMKKYIQVCLDAIFDYN